jgi:hypothetical protein
VSKQGVYGFPHVKNPNDFQPDHESSSPEEIAAHKLACQTYGKPEHQPNKGSFSQYDDSGNLVLHVTRTSWGIGVNYINHCDGCNEPTFNDPMMVCHECGGPEFCATCWPEHEKRHEDGDLRA